MKTLRFSLLSVLLLMCNMMYAYDFESNGIYYNYYSYDWEGKPVSVSVTYPDSYGFYSGNITIPKYTFDTNGEHLAVVAIGYEAFYGCHQLTSVTIPNSISEINSGAFSYCSQLTSIFIPNSVSYISESAFRCCSELTSIVVDADNSTYDSRDNSNAIIETRSKTLVVGCKNTYIPTSVTTIGAEAFFDCDGLTSINIPASVTTIGEHSFYDCNGLTSINLPESLTTIGYSAFSYCNELTGINLPESLTTIGSSAFYGCSRLTSINIPANVTSIEGGLFGSCFELKNIVVAADNPCYDSRDNCNAVIETASNTLMVGCSNTKIPASVTSIGNSAFSYCYGLTSINIPASVTTIGAYAFADCYGLTSINLPESLTTIGNDAFNSCTNLRTIVNNSNLALTAGSSEYGYVAYYAYRIISGEPVDGFYFDGTDGAYILTAYMGNATNLQLPDNYKGQGYSIGMGAFYDCSELTSITIPNTVTSIGNAAFNNCDGLTSIDIPNGVTSIGNKAFYDCDGLASINIPNGVTNIGESTFYSCDNLASITIPNTVTSIGNYAFYNCVKLTSIDIPNGVTSIGNSAFSGCKKLSSIDIPSGVTSIGRSAFYDCDGLASINIPNGVTNIGENTFSSCDNLASITIPNTVTSIGNYAFYNCKKLSSIDIPSGVTSIGSSAFQSCSGLTSIKIPDGVTSIEGWTFAHCDNLASITIPNTVTSIGNDAFFSCGKLTSIDIPSGVTSIGSSAFQHCSGLTSIKIPDGMTSIEEMTFAYCSNLTYVIIPNSINSIKDDAFYQCRKLETILNNSNLTLTKGSTDYGYVAYYAIRIASGECVDGFYFSGTSGAYKLTCYLGNKTSLTLPDNYKGEGYKIDECAFYGCDSLTSVVIPNSVTGIGYQAFENCSALKNVEIPESVTSIGYRAFYGCSFDYIYFLNPTPVTYSDFLGTQTVIFVPGISLDTYRNADGWKQWAHIITTKERAVQDIIVTASSSGSAIRKAIGNDDIVNEVYSLTIKGTINSYDIIVLNQKMPNLTILDLSEAQIVACDYPYSGSSCTADSTLSSSLFYKHASLSSIKLPKEMRGAMESSVFYQCPKLREVVLPSGVTSIGSSAFYNCDGLTSVTIPNSVTNIGSSAFSGCSRLTSVTIPNSVTNIGNYAFQYCNGLKSVTLGNSVTNIGAFAFRDCYKLQSIKIPASVTTINESTFRGCSNLTSVTLPPRLTTIGYDAFYGTKLTEVRLPSSLRSISSSAFSTCPLQKVYTYTILPLSISSETFGNAASAELYLPETSSDYYYFAAGWNEFLAHKTFNEPYEYFYLNGDFTMDDNTGFVEGEDGEHPDVDINIGGGLVVDGEQSDNETPNQSLGDVNLENDGNGNSGSIIGDNNLSVDNLNININVTSGKWYFFAFPFDIMLEDISLSNGGSYVWRYYDGAERANGKTGWKTVNGNKLNAAQGYIFQCSKSGVLTLNIENVRFKKEDKYLELLAHVSANLKDASWNFMGNPYLSYYDMSDMDYTAPVTVWDGSKYVAMRPGDDEYHFAPFQTFFVQKSEGTASVGFQGDKQMTQKQSQNKKAQAAAAPKMQVMSESEEQPARQLINLVLTSGEQTDGTRIVFNDAQSRAYESECDAAKFETQGVIQLFTIGDQKERYAINERPADNGVVALGFSTPTAGDFTISAARMDTPVYLKDRETGSVYDLRQGAYQFSAGAGTHANRFEVLLEATVTGIQEVGTATEGDATKVYDLGGRRVKENGKGVFIINGEKTLVK